MPTIPEDFFPPIASAHQMIGDTLMWMRTCRTIPLVSRSFTLQRLIAIRLSAAKKVAIETMEAA